MHLARTHNSINAFILSVIAALAVTGAAACDNTARGVKEDAKQAEIQTRDERAEAKATARELGNDVARAANRTGEAASEAGEEVAERADAVLTTIEVKTALMADASVDATRIDVGVDYKTRILTLNGLVPTATEKDMAEIISSGHAEGYRVVNNLEVRPR
jgi:osmotically-inducible protein OsmY